MKLQRTVSRRVLTAIPAFLAACAVIHGTNAQANPLQCEAVFGDRTKDPRSQLSVKADGKNSISPRSGLMSTAEVDFSESEKNAALSPRTGESLQEIFSSYESDTTSTNALRIRLISFRNGRVILQSEGIGQSLAEKLAQRIQQSTVAQAELKKIFLAHPRGAVQIDFSVDNKARLTLQSERGTTTTLQLTFPSDANQIRSQSLHFEGRDAFPDYDQSLRQDRENWDSRFSKTEWSPIGVESPFGTVIEKVEALIGTQIAGIEFRLEGTLGKPMKAGRILEYKGQVQRVWADHSHGLDPLWLAEVSDIHGTKHTVNLSNSLGLRVEISSLHGRDLPRGHEEEAQLARRQSLRDEFVKHNQSPVDPRFKKSIHQDVEERLARLPVETANKLRKTRETLLSLYQGRSARAQVLSRNDYDRAPRPVREMLNEDMRPMAEESRRQLYDTDGEFGFNRWMADFMTNVYISAAEHGSLHFGSRQVKLRDVHDNYPWAEGMNGLRMEQIDVSDLPIVSQADIVRVVDERILHYGFDEGIKDVPGLTFAEGSHMLATLVGESLDETTFLFQEYNRHNIMFLDTYFSHKPHGVFSHVLQFFYLAERMTHPDQNAFHANMRQLAMKAQGYFQDDAPTDVLVTDHVGQRTPANPDHINNMLRLGFDAP